LKLQEKALVFDVRRIGCHLEAASLLFLPGKSWRGEAPSGAEVLYILFKSSERGLDFDHRACHKLLHTLVGENGEPWRLIIS
jgi:hypothetical protein